MASFELKGPQIIVRGELGAEEEEDFRKLCVDLLLSGAEKVKIDLSGVETIASVCVGALVVLWIDLCAAGRRMELAASPAVKRVLNMAGLADVFPASRE